jgi:hypothetical protein
VRFSLMLLVACGGDAVDGGEDDTDVVAPTTVEVDDSSFPCITSMASVRGFYADNLLGNADATLAVANDPQGQVWPVGSLVQLVPTEAMVKREAGFSASTGDWEFFYLKVEDTGTTILDRGTGDVVNAFNGNCASCHAAAQADWDWICESGHGCVDLPLTDEVIQNIQNADPRCGG